MPVDITTLRDERVNAVYVGFVAASRNVKPVHVANGLYRTLLARHADTEFLNRVAFHRLAKGDVPRRHEIGMVYERLATAGRIDPADVSQRDLSDFRILLKQVLGADEGVFPYEDAMSSYSAGSDLFVSDNRIAQDAGEFVAEWLRRSSSPLASTTVAHLVNRRDAVTALCRPLLADDGWTAHRSTFEYDRLRAFTGAVSPAGAASWRGLAEAAESLALHTSPDVMPDSLSALRLVVLFACFVVVRHMANLETAHVPGAPLMPPFLLDFSEGGGDPIARASTYSYIGICRAISRFHGWALGEALRTTTPLSELTEASPPTYRRRPVGGDEREIWRLACDDASRASDPYQVYGHALFDILARVAEANPISYLRQIGHRSGLMWPPTNLHPSKRLLIQQDMLEVLVRGAVPPGTTVDLADLRERFWTRYGIVVGGGPRDEEILLEQDIYQADATALSANGQRFAARLRGLDFARLLADGVLQVRLEGAHAVR